MLENMKHVLIIHGWRNSRAEDHWQRHLATALRKVGHSVHYPQLPDTESPNFADWAQVLIAELEMMSAARREGEEVVVLAHSLGCSTWLRLGVDGLLPIVPDRLLLVAPPDSSMLTDVSSFIVESTELVKTALHASAKAITLLGSDDDPWMPRGIQETHGNALGLEALIFEGAKHLALGDGFGHWQGVIDWVLEPTANLRIR